MSETPHLTGLIQDLRRSTSRIEQLKILTRAWKTVQGLTPAERVELAKHVGMREGLSLLERLGKPGGLSPAALAQAVVKAEQSSPGQLNQILRDLRTASTRGRGIRESVAMLDTVLEQESTGGEEPPVATIKPPRPGSETPPPLPEPPRRTIPLEPKDTDSGRAMEVKGEAAKSRRAKQEPSGETATTPLKVPRPEKPKAVPASAGSDDNTPPPISSRPEPAPPGATLDIVEKPFYPETPSWGRPFRATEDEPTLSPVSQVGAKTTAGASLAALRRLDRLIDTEPSLEERLDAVLAALPPGWPRRRGLSRLIRSGAVSETAKILPAIAALENPFDEFWCLSAWLHSTEPSREELEAALRQTRSAAGKRLLKRRL